MPAKFEHEGSNRYHVTDMRKNPTRYFTSDELDRAAVWLAQQRTL